MVKDDPEDELAHFRLGQVLMDDEQYPEAVKSFERTLELTPHFSKVFQLLGDCLIKVGQKDRAIEVLTKGWTTADERGDRLPMEAMGKLLTSLGAANPAAGREGRGGRWLTRHRLQVPAAGLHGRQASPPTPGLAPPRRDRPAHLHRRICAGCWNLWFKDLSIKVINELRLDLSSDFGQAEYDKHMREFMGFEDEPKA